MAGDWIPLRLDLSDDPAVLAVCARTGLDEYAVIGRLHKLWCWANRHLKDGHAPGVTAAWVDQYVAKKGFAAALSSADWLVLSGGGLTFPKFDNWNSKSAKKRLMDTRAKSMKRAGQFADTVRLADGHLSDNSKTREEKRREERNTPLPPTGGEAELIRELAAQTGEDPSLPAMRKKFEDTASGLLAATPPYTPAEVRAFGLRWREFCTYSAAKDRPRPSLADFARRIGGLRAKANGKPAPKRVPTRAVVADLIRRGHAVTPDVLALYPELNGVA